MGRQFIVPGIANAPHRTVAYLRTFGGLSAKPLELRGRWPALSLLQEVHRLAWPDTRNRSSVQLMKKGARLLNGFMASYLSSL